MGGQGCGLIKWKQLGLLSLKVYIGYNEFNNFVSIKIIIIGRGRDNEIYRISVCKAGYA
jgi:hypothetical protein